MASDQDRYTVPRPQLAAPISPSLSADASENRTRRSRRVIGTFEIEGEHRLSQASTSGLSQQTSILASSISRCGGDVSLPSMMCYSSQGMTEDEEEEEDPHERVKSATTASAFITFLKALFGVSLLFQPRILGETGLILGTVVHVVIISCCGLSCYLLLMARSKAIERRERTLLEEEYQQRVDEVKCSRSDNLKGMSISSADRSRSLNSVGSVKMKLSNISDGPLYGMKDRFVTYSDLVRQLLGRKAAAVITAVVFVLHVLFASGMVNSATRNLLVLAGWHPSFDDEEYIEYEYEPDPGRRLRDVSNDGSDDYTEAQQMNSISGGFSHLALTCLIFPIVLKLLLIRNLAGMFFVSALGLIAYFVGCVGSMIYSAMQYSEWEGGYDAPDDIWKWKWAGVPAYVASTVYAIEGIQLALPTANNIADPQKTVPIVSGAVFFYGLLTIAIAWVGYLGGLGGGEGTIHGVDGCNYLSMCLSSDILTVVHEVSLSAALLFTLPVILYPSTELMELWVEQRYADREAGGDDDPRQSTLSKANSSWWNSVNFRTPTYSRRVKLFLDKKAPSSQAACLGTCLDDVDYVDMDAPGYHYPTEDSREENGSSELSPSKDPTPSPLTPRTDNPSDKLSAHFYPRLCLAIAICIIGALEQYSYGLISFTRGVLLSFAGFILPPLLYFAAMRAEGRIRIPMCFLLAGLILFGIFTMVLAFIPHFTEIQYMTVDIEEWEEERRRSGHSQD